MNNCIKGLHIRSKKAEGFFVHSIMDPTSGITAYFVTGSKAFKTKEECQNYIDRLRVEDVQW